MYIQKDIYMGCSFVLPVRAIANKVVKDFCKKDPEIGSKLDLDEVEFNNMFVCKNSKTQEFKLKKFSISYKGMSLVFQINNSYDGYNVDNFCNGFKFNTTIDINFGDFTFDSLKELIDIAKVLLKNDKVPYFVEDVTQEEWTDIDEDSLDIEEFRFNPDTGLVKSFECHTIWRSLDIEGAVTCTNFSTFGWALDK